MKDWRIWAHGLLGAVIGGTATSLLAAFTFPEEIAKDLRKFGMFAVVSGIFHTLFYLKQSPLPKIHKRTVKVVETTVIKEESGPKPTGEAGPFSPS